MKNPPVVSPAPRRVVVDLQPRHATPRPTPAPPPSYPSSPAVFHPHHPRAAFILTCRLCSPRMLLLIPGRAAVLACFSSAPGDLRTEKGNCLGRQFKPRGKTGFIYFAGKADLDLDRFLLPLLLASVCSAGGACTNVRVDEDDGGRERRRRRPGRGQEAAEGCTWWQATERRRERAAARAGGRDDDRAGAAPESACRVPPRVRRPRDRAGARRRRPHQRHPRYVRRPGPKCSVLCATTVVIVSSKL